MSRSANIDASLTPPRARAARADRQVAGTKARQTAPRPANRSRSGRFGLPAVTLAPVALAFSMQDEWGQDVSPAYDAVHKLGNLCHYQMKFAQSFGTGKAEACGFADGFFLFLLDVDIDQPCAMQMSAPDLLRVRIALEAEGEYAPIDGEALTLSGPCAALIIEPPGQLPAEVIMAGRNKTVQIYIHRDALQRLYADGEQDLPAPVQSFLAGTLQQTFTRRLSLNSGLVRCLEDMQECKLDGRSRQLFLHSTAVNILCHIFDALAHDDSFGSSDASAVTTRSVIAAQKLLADNFVVPPSLDQLAHQVGLSRTRLCTGFRQITGHSVFDYVTDLRMKRALELLKRRDASITEIAYAVGYSHPSTFSVAIQRRYGTSPRKLRRDG